MVFYLKVNRENNYSLRCLQQWIDVVATFENSKAYILCDRESLKNTINETIDFKNTDIQFLGSCYDSEDLKYIVGNVTDAHWTKAGFAHLTTFLHAKEQGFEEFWNIDADDTYFCLEEKRIHEALETARAYAREEKYILFSLDMWRTRTRGKHWSFGITYTDNTVKWIDVMKEYSTNFELRSLNQPPNVDGYFTYLKAYTDLKIGTFYFENLKFVHFSDNLFKRPIDSGFFHWKDGKVLYPIVYYCFGSEKEGLVPIYEDVVRLDIGIEDKEAFIYLTDNAKGQKTGLAEEVEELRRG